MALKPWYTVVTPREDLREGRPLDASEFAVHLDQVRDERAPDIYRKPEQFFERTHLTRSLAELGSQVLRRHEAEMTAPAGDVIRRFMPQDRPCLVLLDELMNYVSRSRRSGMAAQLYNFLQNLAEEARGRRNVVLAVSIPASELEMTA